MPKSSTPSYAIETEHPCGFAAVFLCQWFWTVFFFSREVLYLKIFQESSVLEMDIQLPSYWLLDCWTAVRQANILVPELHPVTVMAVEDTRGMEILCLCLMYWGTSLCCGKPPSPDCCFAGIRRLELSCQNRQENLAYEI